MRLFCAAAANIAERISIFGRIWLLMPSARLFFFLFTHAKYVRLPIYLRFSVMRLHLYLRLFAFLIMRLHAHSFSRIISLLFPSLFPGAFLFSPISKGRWTIFMRSLSARHSLMVAQGQFLAEFPEKQSDFLFRSAREPLFFALLSVSLHFCPAPMVKSVQKSLKRAFFRPFWAVLRGIKTPEKVLKKAWKTTGASQKMAVFWQNRAFLAFQKSLSDDFRQNFS